jgi:membrane protease YdiL (CAAX protease family)
LDPTSSRQSRASQVLFFWLGAFVLANLASVGVLVATGNAGAASSDISTLDLALSATAMWAVYLFVTAKFLQVKWKELRVAIGAVIRRHDVLVGVPLGIASQLILVNAVNWPLARLFPDSFSFDEVSRRATELTDQAQGLWIVVLVLVVVIGAPIAEEILYRGVLQNGATALLGVMPGLVTTAGIFALVHFSPVEIPGLFAFALVLGLLRKNSGRLGLPIAAHMAFNVAGLLLVALV